MANRHPTIRRIGLITWAVILLIWPLFSWIYPWRYCADPGGCVTVYGAGPVGWAVSLILVVCAVVAIRAAIKVSPRRRD